MLTTFHVGGPTQPSCLPPPLPPPAYSYASDSQHSHWNLKWDSLSGFKTWKRPEEQQKCIEYRVQDAVPATDNLKKLYFLVKQVVPFYMHKQLCQQYGFKGLNLKMKKRRDVDAKAKIVPKEDIQVRPSRPIHNSFQTTYSPPPVQPNAQAPHCYTVCSQADPETTYLDLVDTLLSTCTCPAFPSINYCKHLAAVKLHFPLPNSLDTPGLEDLGACATGSASTSTGAAASTATVASASPPVVAHNVASTVSAAWDRTTTKYQALLACLSLHSDSPLAPAHALGHVI